MWGGADIPWKNGGFVVGWEEKRMVGEYIAQVGEDDMEAK